MCNWNQNTVELINNSPLTEVEGLSETRLFLSVIRLVYWPQQPPHTDRAPFFRNPLVSGMPFLLLHVSLPLRTLFSVFQSILSQGYKFPARVCFIKCVWFFLRPLSSVSPLLVNLPPLATLHQATKSINTVINANTPGVLSGAENHEGKFKALFYLHVTLCENLWLRK